jgi:hypothetical protein
MGIEPTRAAPPGLENKRFGATADPKCEGRVNFRGMWGLSKATPWRDYAVLAPRRSLHIKRKYVAGG